MEICARFKPMRVTGSHSKDLAQARLILSDLILLDPNNAKYWILMSKLVRRSREQSFCLKQALRTEPTNRKALDSLSKLQAMEQTDAIQQRAMQSIPGPEQSGLSNRVSSRESYRAGMTGEIAARTRTTKRVPHMPQAEKDPLHLLRRRAIFNSEHEKLYRYKPAHSVDAGNRAAISGFATLESVEPMSKKSSHWIPRRLDLLDWIRNSRYLARAWSAVPSILAVVVAISGLAFVLASCAKSFSLPTNAASSAASRNLAESRITDPSDGTLTGKLESSALAGPVELVAPTGGGVPSQAVSSSSDESRNSSVLQSSQVTTQEDFDETSGHGTVSAPYRLPDISESWAQMNFYDWSPSGFSPANFGIQANVAWESASDKANWWNSGCGFVFRMNARGDHYLALLSLDGWAYLYRNLGGTITTLGRGNYDMQNLPAGEAEFELLVQGDSINLIVNEDSVLTHQDDYFSKGILGFALASGTNKDFGTKCDMTNIELWDLEE